MATSTVARGGIARFGSTLILLLANMAPAQAQSGALVQPTNNSDSAASMIQMKVTGGPLSLSQRPYNIVPLTQNAGLGVSATALQQLDIEGNLKAADPTTASNLTSNDIAYIACDPNGSNITPSDVFETAEGIRPKAIVLYSLSSNECNLTGSLSYTTIYSMTSASESSNLSETISIYPSTTNILSAMIGSNTTSTAASATASSDSNQGGPAPTTAVAMSILYSITGIITLLFLIIIATGAVRAHRHPERYGPRSGYAGRPRQSRAKGLARAMLETLPIVKFGDPEPVKPGQREIELEEGSTSNAAATDPSPQQEGVASSQTSPSKSTTAAAGGMEAREEDQDKDKEPATGTTPQEGELGCSICTEDFTTGEDVRVLPCHHKYHPACIDPWLLNVSGTCPLCRHDLRPDTAPTSPTEAETSELPPPLNVAEDEAVTAAESSDTHQRRRRSRFLDLARLRAAPPEERIAALRELRQQTRTEEPATEESREEQQSRRARLTGRLKEKFRIKTRTQDTTNTNTSTTPEPPPPPPPTSERQ